MEEAAVLKWAIELLFGYSGILTLSYRILVALFELLSVALEPLNVLFQDVQLLLRRLCSSDLGQEL